MGLLLSLSNHHRISPLIGPLLSLVFVPWLACHVILFRRVEETRQSPYKQGCINQLSGHRASSLAINNSQHMESIGNNNIIREKVGVADWKGTL